ncbi:arginase family protein [Chryseobacterium sp. CT-SW4]|uniref:arginase family protein n=1 Tax=Chryseobacterium sp. SW-1 TaxID=3157343 RepID=UPI003B0258C0
MNRDINIFEFPFNLGLIKKDHEKEPGVIKLPDWLRKLGFHKKIDPTHVFRLDAPPYEMKPDEETQVKNTDLIIQYALRQAVLISDYFNPGNFNIVLGGDCSILIGNAIALKKRGKFGLFYLDGHTDFIPPRLSPSGGAAGMDLAIVTGLGHEKLTNIGNIKPYFEEKHIFCAGNAETDDREYVEQIINSEIHYLDIDHLRRNGFSKTAKDFLKMVEDEKLDGFFIHLDVDVLMDEIMPMVDSRMEDGLTYSDLKEILIPLIAHPQCVGIEITILDPDYDPEGIHTKNFIENITEIFKSI